jgi:hypothetical protein
METIWRGFVEFMACTGVATWILVVIVALNVRHGRTGR